MAFKLLIHRLTRLPSGPSRGSRLSLISYHNGNLNFNKNLRCPPPSRIQRPMYFCTGLPDKADSPEQINEILKNQVKPLLLLLFKIILSVLEFIEAVEGKITWFNGA